MNHNLKLGIRRLALGVLAAVALPVWLLAAEPWEKALTDQGWARVSADEIKTFAGNTLYGAKGIKTADLGRISYIHPGGKQSTFQFVKGGKKHILDRELHADGRLCLRSKEFWQEREVCRTLWKKGDVILLISDIGVEIGAYTLKKGNTEGF